MFTDCKLENCMARWPLPWASQASLHSSVLHIMQQGCLVFNGTFNVNRLYHATVD